MAKVRITLACGDYDRTWPLRDGAVVPEGIDLNYLCLGAEEVFWRMLRNGEFDASEISLSSYIMAHSRGDESLIAIPVFPSRIFRHSCIFIHSDAGINEPGDLRGKRIGVPEYQMTAAVWIRGILQDEYGVAPRDCYWFTGGLEHPGRVEKLSLQLPDDTRIVPIPEDKTLSQMLVTGEIDALFTARTPSCFAPDSSRVRRLFPNYKDVEKDYYQRTGIFPIMHTIVLKRELYELYPWVAQSLFKAFNQAKEIACRGYFDSTAPHYSLPFLISTAEEMHKVFGTDFWPYGVKDNEKTIEALLRYSYEQGLSQRKLTIKELFAPETFEEFKI